MILTGEAALDPQGYFVEQIRAVLESGLAGETWAPKFEKWSGVRLVIEGGPLSKDNPQLKELYDEKRPFVLLEGSDEREDSETASGNPRHLREEVSVELYGGDATRSCEKDLKAAVPSIIRSNEAVFEALGIEGVEIHAGQGQNEKPWRINPYTISGEVFVEVEQAEPEE